MSDTELPISLEKLQDGMGAVVAMIAQLAIVQGITNVQELHEHIEGLGLDQMIDDVEPEHILYGAIILAVNTMVQVSRLVGKDFFEVLQDMAAHSRAILMDPRLASRLEGFYGDSSGSTD